MAIFKIPTINLNLSFKDQLVIEKDREEVLKKLMEQNINLNKL